MLVLRFIYLFPHINLLIVNSMSTRKQTRQIDLTQIREAIAGKVKDMDKVPENLRERVLLDCIVEERSKRPSGILNFVPISIDPNTAIGIMRREVDRITKAEVKGKMFDADVNMAPSFAGLTLDIEQKYTVHIINGAVVKERHNSEGALRGDIVVGDRVNGCGHGNDFCLAPITESNGSLEDICWSTLSDATKDAIAQYAELSGRRVREKIKMPKFSDERPNKSNEYANGCDIELSKLKAFLSALSESAVSEEGATYFSAEIILTRYTKIYVNSDGTELAKTDSRMLIILGAEEHSDKGTEKLEKYYYFRDNLDKTDFEKMRTDTIELLCGLKELRKAPIQEGGEYPVIISPAIHAVLWHEVIGHGLEKREDSSDRSLLTFRGRLGTQVCPKTISLIDDPTLPNAWGTYNFDDEGVKAQMVVLVDKGKLVGYLHSRATAGEEGVQSNGHARAEATTNEDMDIFNETGIPCPRMSNLIVLPEVTFPTIELFEQLIGRLIHDKKEYGIYLRSGRGGQVDESGHFEITPNEIYRIYQDGRVERVKGVKVIGTPFAALSQMRAFGEDAETSPGYCGAESGWIPVSETTPSAFVLRLELAPVEEDKETGPLIPRPKRE